MVVVGFIQRFASSTIPVVSLRPLMTEPTGSQMVLQIQSEILAAVILYKNLLDTP
jgi:hypothetical protein